MRILFSNPPWWPAGGPHNHGIRAGSRWPFTGVTRSSPGRPIFGGYMPYPLFMAYAASYARRHLRGCEVSFHDSIAVADGYVTWMNLALENDFIVLESASSSWEHDLLLIRSLRKCQYPPRVILVGPIAVSKHVENLDPDLVHAVVKGEYEKGVVRVINGETGVLEHDLLTEDEMNDAPHPMLTGSMSNYWDSNPAGTIHPQLQAWTSRGCWAKCIFCVWPAVMTGNDPDGTKVRKVRRYRPEVVEDNLRSTFSCFAFKHVYLDDDVFNTSDAHVQGICRVMSRVGVPWTAMCRGDRTSKEIWSEMASSGCVGVKIGFESGSQRVLDRIVNKHLDLGEAERTCETIRSLGMTIHGTFMVGLPGETDAERQQTFSFMRRLVSLNLINTYQLSGAAEHDGTPLQTLGTGRLDKYPDAVKDESYSVDADGNAKLRRM